MDNSDGEYISVSPSTPPSPRRTLEREATTTTNSDSPIDSSDLFFGLGSNGSNCSDDDENSEDFPDKMDFLQEKQRILQRASIALRQEETYDASVARVTANPPSRANECETVWDEAKDILRKLGNKGKPVEEAMLSPSPRHTSSMKGRPQKRCTKTPRHPSIELRSVAHKVLSSSSPSLKDTSATTLSSKRDAEEMSKNDMRSLSNTSVSGKGRWMVEALVRGASVADGGDSSDESRHIQKNTDDPELIVVASSWKIVSNPLTHSLGLLPPAQIPLKDTMTIQEAVGVSSDARIVTQAIPPFGVVHANKAFLTFADLNSSESIIGKPVESILQVITSRKCPDYDQGHHSAKTSHNLQITSQPQHQPQEDEMHARFISGVDPKNCRIRVAPVILGGSSCLASAPSGHRRRLNDGSSRRCLSHVLIHVLHDASEGGSGCDVDQFSKGVVRGANHNGPILVGTVG